MPWSRFCLAFALVCVCQRLGNAQGGAALESLVEKLGSVEFDLREAAGKALFASAQQAIPYLRKAAQSTDTELRLRAADLLRIHERRGQVGVAQAPAGIVALDVAADGRRAVSGGADKVVHVWDLDANRCLFRLAGHTKEIWCAAIAPDGSRAVTGGQDGILRLWDIELGKEIRAFQPTGVSIRCVLFSRDGRQVFSGGFDARIRMWDVNTGQEVGQLEGHADGVFCLALSEDGKQLISGAGYNDRTVRLWDLAGCRELRRFAGHEHAVITVACGPGKKIYSGSADKTIRMWNQDTGQCVHTFSEPGGAVNTLCISPDGRFLLSGGAEDALRLWDLKTGLEWRRYQGHTAAIYGVRIFAAGRRALSAGTDKSLRQWELPLAKKQVP